MNYDDKRNKQIEENSEKNPNSLYELHNLNVKNIFRTMQTVIGCFGVCVNISGYFLYSIPVLQLFHLHLC